MARPLILIGPMHAGKSTIAALLAGRFGVPRICMDDVRWDYYKEIGYTEADQKAAYDRGGFAAMVAYWKPFEAHAVERLLADHANDRCVIDFGAGHSVYEDVQLLERVRRAMEPYAVVLLLPSPDVEESIAILRARRDERHPEQAGRPTDVNEHFVRHPSNAQLAKFTIYTKGRSPEQAADDIATVLASQW
jgi:shikimate kinase